MNKKTRENLKIAAESFARWSQDIICADPYVTAIEDNLPEETEGDAYHSMSTSYGNIFITLWQATSVREIGPFLRAARIAGFSRTKRVEDPNNDQIAWTYEAKVGDNMVKAIITLALKKGERAACRYVRTGKKEVPVMELLCGEKLEAWEKAQAATA